MPQFGQPDGSRKATDPGATYQNSHLGSPSVKFLRSITSISNSSLGIGLANARQKCLQPFGAGILKNIFRRTLLNNAPMLHEYHPIGTDRKSTRLNSSHVKISYAVFCLKKKK